MALSATKVGRYLGDVLEPGEQPRAAEVCVFRPTRKQVLKNLGVSGVATAAASVAAAAVVPGLGIMTMRKPAPLVVLVTDSRVLASRRDQVKLQRRGKSRVLLDVPLSAVTARRLRSGVMNRVELVRTDSAEHLVTFAFGARARAARRLEAALSTAH